MPLMSYRAYALHRNCSLRAVQKAVGDPDSRGIRDGRIAAALIPVAGSPHPKIDSARADALWLLNTDEAKRSTLFTPSAASQQIHPTAAQHAALAAQPSQPDPFAPLPLAPPGAAADDTLPELDPPAPTDDPETRATKKSYHESRALREKISAENAQLDLDMRKGGLISLDDARQVGFTALRTLRDSLRNIGARISSQLAAQSDPFACEQLVSLEIDAALASVTAENLLTEPTDDEEDPDHEAAQPGPTAPAGDGAG